MHSDYEARGLAIIGFPCNQFGGQEPGSPADIQAVLDNYGAKFPVMAKCNVNGANALPVFKYLRQQAMPGKDISWNFNKFLCDANGNNCKQYDP